VKSHPWGTALLLVGGAILVYLLARTFWPHIVKWWDEAKVGGGIIVHPGLYFGGVFLPSLLAWFAGLAVMAVFLHAYGIPNNFHTLMRISGGNSLANVTSATPGGAASIRHSTWPRSAASRPRPTRPHTPSPNSSS
jgi:hypothetical protein